jgi:Uncharacterised nucleotidyltransferase
VERRPPLADVLSLLLPTAEETDLLRVCLDEDQPVASRSRADNVFAHVGPLQKCLLPLLAHAVRPGDVADASLRSQLRAALVSEELRHDAYNGVLHAVLAGLAAARVPAIVLKGAALADTVYPQPGLRHSHDIDLLVAPEDMARAQEILVPIGLRRAGADAATAAPSLTFVHPSGLPIQLHTRLFRSPFYQAPLAQVWARSEPAVIAHAAARTLSAGDALAQILGQAASAGSRESLLWVCDAWCLSTRNPALDWVRFVDVVCQSSLALPVAIQLRYLCEAFELAVDGAALQEIEGRAHRATLTEREAAIYAVRAGARGRLREMWMRGACWRTRVALLKWMALPSPRLLRTLTPGLGAWTLPLQYVRRPLGYLTRRLRQSTGAPTHAGVVDGQPRSR